MKVGIIGYGKIGTEVGRRVLERNWEIGVVTNTSGVYKVPEKGLRIKVDEPSNWLNHFEKVDIAVLCIPTLDNGKIAYDYIKTLVEKDIPVVTSEKGAFGNYFPELESWIDKIGYSAVVGGGTRMLHWLRDRLTPPRHITEIHLIINGTLNYCLDGWDRGRDIDEVVEEAKKLNYAEPGAQNTLEVINTESCRDVPMKIASLLNVCNFGKIRAKDIDIKRISGADLKKLARESHIRRHIVSIVRKENDDDIIDMIGGFKFEINDWCVSAGFKNKTENPLFRQLVPPGVNNAALIHGVDGTYILTGPGAGDTPTVMGAIIKDIEDFSLSKI